jgi:hypothetical protein
VDGWRRKTTGGSHNLVQPNHIGSALGSQGQLGPSAACSLSQMIEKIKIMAAVSPGK